MKAYILHLRSEIVTCIVHMIYAQINENNSVTTLEKTLLTFPALQSSCCLFILFAQFA